MDPLPPPPPALWTLNQLYRQGLSPLPELCQGISLAVNHATQSAANIRKHLNLRPKLKVLKGYPHHHMLWTQSYKQCLGAMLGVKPPPF